MAVGSEAKYRRAAITLQLGVPEIWMEDGSEARIVAAIERLFNSNTSGVGPGGSVLHAMFVLSWKPGDVAKLPTGAEIEPLLEKWRAEYPLRTKDEVRTDYHEPPGYPSRALDWPEESHAHAYNEPCNSACGYYVPEVSRPKPDVYKDPSFNSDGDCVDFNCQVSHRVGTEHDRPKSRVHPYGEGSTPNCTPECTYNAPEGWNAPPPGEVRLAILPMAGRDFDIDGNPWE